VYDMPSPSRSLDYYTQTIYTRNNYSSNHVPIFWMDRFSFTYIEVIA